MAIPKSSGYSAAGADVNSENHDGTPALTLAAQKGHTETVQSLIAAGADVNAKKKMKGLLDWAAFNGHAETVRILRCWC